MKIGIAGGIGSGKSYVARRLEAQGFQVYDCDSAAKRLMRESPVIHEKLTALIGPDAYLNDGSLNKPVIAKFLLASEQNAKAIDNIVHPEVFKDFEQSGLEWMESGIMFESGINKLVDKVMVVIAPQEVRIQRVMSRDKISREQALEWMGRQLPQREVISRSDFVIINDGQMDIDKQIHKIIEQCNKQF